MSAEQLAQQEGRARCLQCRDILYIPADHLPKPPDTPESPLLLSRLILKYEGVVFEHKGPHHQLKLGRQKSSDIRVRDGRVSRIHATISYAKGKYILCDESLNGTYVLINNRQGVTVRNGEMMLVNRGVIGLGSRVNDSTRSITASSTSDHIRAGGRNPAASANQKRRRCACRLSDSNPSSIRSRTFCFSSGKRYPS